MAWELVAAGIGAIGSIFGASAQKSQQDQARALQQKAIDRQFKKDKQDWRFNWHETQRNYRYLKKGIDLQRQNEETLGAYRDATNLQEYNYKLKIQDYEYAQQMRLYNKSEQLFRQQRGFNEQAAQLAYASENRRLQETFQEAAFDNQDLLVKMLQEEGQLVARGQSGRSAGKALQSAVASYGRNQAIIAASLVSAERQSQENRRNIALSKYGADLTAEGNRMLLPDRLPELPAPIKVPRSVFQDPRKPRKPPKPIKMANTTPAGSSMPIWNSAISGIAGVTGSLSSLYK